MIRDPFVTSFDEAKAIMCRVIATIIIFLGASLPVGAGLWVNRSFEPSAPAAKSQQDELRPHAGRRVLVPVGDFPEYRPGAREAGRETFWR